MSELIHNLGIDWRLLIANTVTFFIVLWVLRKFAYGPIMRALEQRQTTIAKGLQDAKQRGDDLEAFAREKEQLLKTAKQSAQGLLHEAEQAAAVLRQHEIEKTQAEAAHILEKARQQLERDRQQMLNQAKKDLSSLVVTATERVLEETVDDALEKKIQAQALKAIQ